MDSKPKQAIKRAINRIPAALIEAAKEIPTTILADVLGRRGTLHSRVRALHPGMRVVGSALTVEVRPGDNLMFHAAIAIAQPGDVIIVDGKADETCALCGDIMATQALARGIAGFVVDAAVRDSNELATKGLPIFSVGTNPCGPSKVLPGRVNWPASVGGVAVMPGDLIVGDDDGVVVVPQGQVSAILVLAQKKIEDEARRIRSIESGQLSAEWLVPQLRAAGVLDSELTL